MEFFQNPIFIGGILPMIFFGMMDFSFRVYAKQLPFQNVFFYTSLGGFFTMILLSFTLFNIPFDNFFELFSIKTFVVGIGLGIIWTICISSMGIAYEKLNANASQIVPIASSNALLTALIGILFLQEKISLFVFALASICIISGIIIVSRAEKNNNKNTSSLLAILLGGFVPLVGFGILNIVFKIYSELSPSILGIIMALTGISIACIIQKIRKQDFIYKPILLNTGVFWALAVGFLGYGFWPLKGDASLLLPIAGASPLISLLCVKLFLDEPVNWKLVMIGASAIIVGLAGLNYWG